MSKESYVMAKTFISQNEFFRNHGGGLLKVANDDPNYGDYLLIHSEEVDKAKEYLKRGYTIVASYEVPDSRFEESEECVDISQPCDFGNHPYKLGYYVLAVVNTSFVDAAYTEGKLHRVRPNL